MGTMVSLYDGTDLDSDSTVSITDFVGLDDDDSGDVETYVGRATCQLRDLEISPRASPDLTDDEIDTDPDSDEEESAPDPPEITMSSIPVVSNADCATISFRMASRNRINNRELQPGGKYDTELYTPIFVHDVLMLPGSLAMWLGKVPLHPVAHAVAPNCGTDIFELSSEEVSSRLTPGLLLGYHASIHSKTQQPCVVPSTEADEHVKGMLIFGQGRQGRRMIHEHYRKTHRRVKLRVELEVIDHITDSNDPDYRKLLHTVRRTVIASAWVWRHPSDPDVDHRTETCKKWTLSDYIKGRFYPQEPILIRGDAKGDEEDDGYIGRDCVIWEPPLPKAPTPPPPPPREVVIGGWGNIDYWRADEPTGW